MELAVIYSDKFADYDFGERHPLKPFRYRLALELMEALLGRVDIIEPRIATKEELLLFHNEAYLRRIEEAGRTGEGLLDLGDTPAFKNCYEAASLSVGASLKAVETVLEEKADHAFNLCGGFHHAYRSRASGFCIFNDAAVAIAYLMKRLKRIAYVDIDAHHGNGVMYSFYSRPMLDIDFHETDIFPGSGFAHEIGEGEGEGLKVNIPLEPFTKDGDFLYAFNELALPILRSYRPEIILLQCGADGHSGDALTRLNLSTRSYREVASKLHGLAHEICGGRLVMFGGGGYNPDSVARCWTVMAAEVGGSEIKNEIPESWREKFEALTGEQPSKKVFDDAPLEKRSREMEKLVEHLKSLLKFKFRFQA